ncbi:MAG: hypothetical protein DKM50_08985 [Candidatus Margulisiibacteriota bacterium]|nr:MAG: hypothetical protein DKM50_08985 [Candidatus Margulisiibacteriota bacterium]HCT83913.1 hypothetical protein [Candidatus Margulisiibacteriota bacterium]HCY36338.1 hypothetical protein [Candidatus Margulisiibacteriota bacterium]
MKNLIIAIAIIGVFSTVGFAQDTMQQGTKAQDGTKQKDQVRINSVKGAMGALNSVQEFATLAFKATTLQAGRDNLVKALNILEGPKEQGGQVGVFNYLDQQSKNNNTPMADAIESARNDVEAAISAAKDGVNAADLNTLQQKARDVFSGAERAEETLRTGGRNQKDQRGQQRKNGDLQERKPERAR